MALRLDKPLDPSLLSDSNDVQIEFNEPGGRFEYLGFIHESYM